MFTQVSTTSGVKCWELRNNVGYLLGWLVEGMTDGYHPIDAPDIDSPTGRDPYSPSFTAKDADDAVAKVYGDPELYRGFTTMELAAMTWLDHLTVRPKYVDLTPTQQ